MENLGKQAKCKITGFSGTITAYSKYICGYESYKITKNDSSELKEEWFATKMVEITE